MKCSSASFVKLIHPPDVTIDAKKGGERTRYNPV